MTSSDHAQLLPRLQIQNTISNITGTKHPIDLKLGTNIYDTKVYQLAEADDVIGSCPLLWRHQLQYTIGNISGTKYPIGLKLSSHIYGTKFYHATEPDDVTR